MFRRYPEDRDLPPPHPAEVAGVPVPPMITFDHRPTWHNRSGNVDRTACIAISISKVRGGAVMRDICRGAGSRRIDPEHAALMGLDPYTQLEPGMHLPLGLEAIGTITIDAETVESLHLKLRGAALLGDYRTNKSNALKSTDIVYRRPGPLPKQRAINPNRGYARPKIHGLADDWSQTIAVERRRLHDRLARDYFICPNAARDADGSVTSTGCLGKVFRLYLPLAYPEEHADAHRALLFLRAIDERFGGGGPSSASSPRPMPGELMRFRAQVTERYAELFPPRRFVCRACLGLRYGEVKLDVLRANGWRGMREAERESRRGEAKDQPGR